MSTVKTVLMQEIIRQRRIIINHTFKLVTNAALAGRMLEAKLRGQEWTTTGCGLCVTSQKGFIDIRL